MSNTPDADTMVDLEILIEFGDAVCELPKWEEHGCSTLATHVVSVCDLKNVKICFSAADMIIRVTNLGFVCVICHQNCLTIRPI